MIAALIKLVNVLKEMGYQSTIVDNYVLLKDMNFDKKMAIKMYIPAFFDLQLKGNELRIYSNI